MNSQEYQVLKKRVAKGLEYLHREYYTAMGGKGRRDPEMMRIVNLWFTMSDLVFDYEKEHQGFLTQND